MKGLIVIAWLCLALPLALIAQQEKVVFGYDAAGNRIWRESISVHKITKADSTQIHPIAPEAIENALCQKIAVYPNPTDGLVNIELSLPVESKCMYTLTSVNGAVIEQGIITSTHTPLNLGHLSKGTYLLRVETSQIKEKFKIVKQ